MNGKRFSEHVYCSQKEGVEQERSVSTGEAAFQQEMN